MNKLIIAIDGLASTGKSTQAKRLAKTLNYIYVDSGAMYRAVTLFGLKQQPEGRLDLGVLTQSLDQIKIHFEGGAEAQQTFLNGENVTSALRDPKINEYVSEVAALEAVRSFLGEQQKRMGTDKGVVMDGRDIGTVIFPQADCKFFLTASAEVRAQRRHQEQLEAGLEESFEEVFANVVARDQQDTSRTVAPLEKAHDAVEIDVSEMTLDEVFDLLYVTVLKKLKS